MQIEAKVASDVQQIQAGEKQVVNDILTVDPGSNVALDISPQFVNSYAREGGDLIITLQDGQTIRLVNFYGDPQKPSQLFLVDENDQLVLTNLTPASDGSFTAAYIPQNVASGFDDSGVGGAVIGGGFGPAGLLGGLALLGGGAALAGGGGGGGDGGGNPPPPPADTTPPGAATNLAISNNGATLTGSGEGGATVGVDTNGDGVIDRTGTVGSNGQFQITLDPPLTNGETVTVFLTDASGNRSQPATVAAPDTTAPAGAEDVAVSPDGSAVSGTAEPGTTVTVDTNGDGIPDGTATVGDDGTFEIPLDPPLTNGEDITVVVSDGAGNDSPPVVVTAPDTTAPAAADDVVISPDGTTLTGTAEPGATVNVDINGDGTPDETATVGDDGTFEVPLDPPLTDGEIVSVIVIDPTGNESDPTLVVAPDLVATPDTPTIEPTNGTEISGTAEPGTTVVVRDSAGNEIGTDVVAPDGSWSVTPDAQLPDGTVIIVVAVNSEGDPSPAATATVDGIAPAAPVIAPSNGEQLVGTAEAGSTVTVTDGAGNVIGTDVVDANGNWSVTPATPLGDGETVSATATDPAGNESLPSTVVIEATLPDIPTIEPTNGAFIEGTADAGNTILITDGDGNPIGQTTADANGDWSFTPDPALTDGTVVQAVAVDGSGTQSAPATTIVDALAPAAPSIEPTNGAEIAGTAEAGATVTVTDGAGNMIGTDVADADGNWSITPTPALADGTVVTATATDAVGNEGPAATASVDAVAPPAPIIGPSNGEQLVGTAEPGATITLTDGAGNLIGTTTADENGAWSFTPDAPLADGTVVNGTATDAAGNESGPGFVTIDASLPAIPVLEPTNGSVIDGVADAGNVVTLTDGDGNFIGEVIAGPDGSFSFTPDPALPDGTVINAVATNIFGDESAPGTITVDAAAPAAPTIEPSNGTELSGSAEAGSIITLTNGSGGLIGYAVTDEDGSWSFTPDPALSDGTVVNATATDAVGNESGQGTTTVDAAAPPTPFNLVVTVDGSLLTGTTEGGAEVRVVVDGDEANPIIVTADANGNFSIPLSPPLVDAEVLTVTASDALGNESAPGTAFAPDLSAPLITVPEAADGYLNGAELTDGIQVDVDIAPGVRAGDVINVTFTGQNGYEVTVAHTVTEADRTAGGVTVTVTPPPDQAEFPEGPATITASVNGGEESAPVATVVDTIPPASPVLSLVGNVLTISAEPGTELTIEVNVAGITLTETVTVDNSGLASLDLLTDLGAELTLDQLLEANVSVMGADAAGNETNVVTLDVLPSLQQPVTIGDIALDVGLLPPVLGISGTADPGSSLRVEVITPLASVFVTPAVDPATGNFTINLLDPDLLSDLGLSITDILNLGAGLSLNLIATDAEGNDSAVYGVSLTGAGLGLNIGEITVTGTNGNDVLEGREDSSETIDAGAGADLILNVGTNDELDAGDGNDTIEIVANNFDAIDGGAGFDTLLLSDGIDFDYNGTGVGTVADIERINLGTGDDGSVVTLTAAEVDAITDGDNILQFTGDGNDTLNVIGAVATGATQTIEGITYDVYTFGNTTLLVEDNSVQVVTA
ncbi:Ig-like domain-containing protein [Allosphingosinicella vermicomposti]|uniref:Ig-like domain-containing protein n=1 Tax=Allosphingosinicella vermicomposti TaxID=614671 RepID=UPI000D0E4C73|nr:Ig-like domain-containing protein [Allosphingosinicella vermicomposti]